MICSINTKEGINMDKKYLMGNSDWLMRSRTDTDSATIISPKLRKNLIMAAMRRAYQFYADFLNISISTVEFEELIVEYERDHSQAISLGLFQSGGIREKDHLNLWCLSHIFLPEVYIESGVFIGSSLHAFINSPKIKKILAIDPDLKMLKIPCKDIPGIEFIDDKDFSQIKINLSGIRSLAYFDDHIDTAARIIQSFDKGLRYVLFDDSTGLEGICQRLYPAIPTIPMIMNAEILSPGDELSWNFNRPSNAEQQNIISRIFRRKKSEERIRVTLAITQELLEKCFEAKKLIKKFEVLPNLGVFIPQQHPGRIVDTSMYIVELEQS